MVSVVPHASDPEDPSVESAETEVSVLSPTKPKLGWSGASSAIWSGFVTQTASYSLMRRWQPAEAALVTGPGTAPNGLPSVAA